MQITIGALKKNLNLYTMKKIVFSFLLLFASISAFSQISGKVIDAEANVSLPGATIIIQGTSTGVISGFDGSFTLDASAGDMLVISFVGYKDVEVEAHEDMIVEMFSEVTSLGEIVISSNVIDLARERENNPTTGRKTVEFFC
jgi:hypothetical protein